MFDIFKRKHIQFLFVYALGFSFGATLFNRNFEVVANEKVYRVANRTSSSLASDELDAAYKHRVEVMKRCSESRLAEYTNPETSEERKQQLVKKVIGFYLVPTSQDRLFGRDIAIVNGPGKPTVMSVDDFVVVQANNRKLLVAADVKRCVDQYRGDKYNTYDQKAYETACLNCLK